MPPKYAKLRQLALLEMYTDEHETMKRTSRNSEYILITQKTGSLISNGHSNWVISNVFHAGASVSWEF